MVNDENVVREELTLESFADMNNLMSSQMEVDIYFPDSTGERLEIRKVTLDCSAKEPVYEQILSILKDGYDGCVSPLNIDTRIENVWVDNTTCMSDLINILQRAEMVLRITYLYIPS